MSPAPEARPAGRVNRGREVERRDVYQQVTLTPSEQRELRERAAGLRVSVPRLLVESALSGVETPAERQAWIAELFELRRLLATVANNVNQLAKVANTSGELPMRDRLERMFGEVCELVVSLRDWMGARR